MGTLLGQPFQGVWLGDPPAPGVAGPVAAGLLPAASSGRFDSQSGASEHPRVRLQHRRHAPSVKLRVPSFRATPHAYAG